jgi:hypothetical protein
VESHPSTEALVRSTALRAAALRAAYLGVTARELISTTKDLIAESQALSRRVWTPPVSNKAQV